MALLGSVPAAQFLIDAASTAVPSSAGAPLQITANLVSDVMSVEIINGTTGTLELLHGPDASLDRLMYIAPSYAHRRQPIVIPKGSRLSIRNTVASAISTGQIVINTWV